MSARGSIDPWGKQWVPSFDQQDRDLQKLREQSAKKQRRALSKAGKKSHEISISTRTEKLSEGGTSVFARLTRTPRAFVARLTNSHDGQSSKGSRG